VLVDPGGDPAAYAALVAWLADQQAPGTEALDRDERFRSALAAAGWVHSRSSFDLLRSVEPEWARPAPRWPEGVAVCGFAPDDAEALHHLIYVDAGWTDVAGHHPRDFAEWQQIFLTGGDDPAPVLAVDGGRLVGGALLRVFSDGAGWVGQLAVARDQRGRGLGRALLLESLQRLQAAGATKLGLSVIATNRTALQLYLGVGLRIDREWQTFVPPEGPAPRDQ
jgi:ribosomal protein S18 acetylase RimI-like enzyme